MAARGTKTMLAWGLATCEVALYKTSAETKPRSGWDTAGPHGGMLRAPEAPRLDTTPKVSSPLSSDPAEAVGEVAQGTGESQEPYFIEQGTGVRVPKSEVRVGIRRDDDTFADLTDGLGEIAERTKLEEMRIADFIRTEEVRRERILGSYYVAPDGPGAAKIVRMLHEAMRVEKRVAVVKWTKRSKQSLGVLVPDPATKSLKVIELAWPEDMRMVPEKVAAPEMVELSEKELNVAVELVQAMRSSRADSLDEQADDSRALIAELIERVEAGEEFAVPERPETPAGADVIDLLEHGLRDREALKRSAA